ncbi:MAG: hypothetical protein M3Z09_10650 [Acidobacteriota bacterium]|nr:hypothetical protein [Acidobacteriota bacterium]
MVSRRRLRSTPGPGTAVHAASFLRQRLIVLDRELLSSPRELKRIWLHELYHFVWWRMSNARRLVWEQILFEEFRSATTGELGWSAEVRKNALAPLDARLRTRGWREYCCESFCDSAAWYAAGLKRHAEGTLTSQARRIRSLYFKLRMLP